MTERVVRRILQAYDITPRTILAPQKGYRNTSYAVQRPDDTYCNLIIYKSEPAVLAKITDAQRAASAARQALPVRLQLDPRILRLQNATRHTYAALYNYLPGHTIPWEAYTQTHIKLLGEALGKLHKAWQPQGQLVQLSVSEEYRSITTRMQRYFATPGVREALQRKLALRVQTPRYFEALLPRCAELPTQHTLHMDFVRGNILFAKPQGQLTISGVLDFEKTAHGHPLFDIARTLAFLLVDCKYVPEAKIYKYFLYSGYQKRGGQPLPSLKVQFGNSRRPLLELLVELFLLYDFYKFLRHNPYEFLSQNQHFIRTKALLERRGIIG